jgi:AcrR family transcriptional regulator
MYDSFGDKESFFEKALDRYEEKVISNVIALLREERGIAALERFVKALTTDGTSDGCFFFNTGNERNHVSPKVLKRVERYLRKLRALVHEKLEEAREDGKFRGDSDVRATQFVVSVAGFMTALKCGFSNKEAGAALHGLLRDISGSPDR